MNNEEAVSNHRLPDYLLLITHSSTDSINAAKREAALITHY